MTDKTKFYILCSLFFVLCSCQTAPGIFDAFKEERQTLPLGGGAAAYIVVDVREAQAILNILPIEELNERRMRQMLDRTRFAAAAIFPQESGMQFQLAAWGNYPSLAGIGFCFSRGWRRRRSEERQTFWHSSANRISIAVSSRQAFVAASLDENPANPFTSGAEIPDGFNEFRQGAMGLGPAPLSSWLVEPAPMLDRFLNEAGIPIRFPVQKLFFNLYTASPEGAASNQFEAVIRLQFENEAQARGMASLLNLAGMFIDAEAAAAISALFFAYPSQTYRNNLDIRTALLSEHETAAILNMFLFSQN